MPIRTCLSTKGRISRPFYPVLSCSVKVPSVRRGRGKERRTDLGKNTILLTRRLLPLRRPPHPIITPLHQPLLQFHRILHEPILLQPFPLPISRLLPNLQTLQQGVKPGIIPLAEQQQQIESRNLTPPAPLARKRAFGQVVEGLQLLEITRET